MERWNGDRENSEAIVQIAAKFARLDHPGKVAIGSSDETNIDRNRSSAAKPLYFLFLQRPQEFGLQFQWQVPNLVQEQRAHMGQFQSSDSL